MKYESLKDQLGELAELRAKYEALQAQMAAVAVLAVATSDEDKKLTQVTRAIYYICIGIFSLQEKLHNLMHL